MSGLPPYATKAQTLRYYGFRVLCGLIFFFLIAPIMVIIPLSFNAQDFFTFTPEMLSLNPDGFSTKHYEDFSAIRIGNWLCATRLRLRQWRRSFLSALALWPRSGCRKAMSRFGVRSWRS